jgi:hypothetical protein
MDLHSTAELRLFITPAELRQMADQFEQEAKTRTVGDDLPNVTCHTAGSRFTRLIILCSQEAVNDIWHANKPKG